MEEYFGNAYRGDPGFAASGSVRDIWIGSVAFSAITWFNPYILKLSNQFNWHDKAVIFEHYHWKKAKAKKQPYKFKWNEYMDKGSQRLVLFQLACLLPLVFLLCRHSL